jgi:ribosome-associated protein
VFSINDQLSIPETELTWSFARSGGPGGQNVNKVSSKAILRWNLGANTTLPDEARHRLRGLERRRITTEDELIITSQTYRDQERNKQDCLDRLRAMILRALVVPKVRKATKPTRASKRRRLAEKKRRGETKAARRGMDAE